jgi:phosphoribosylformylglycinamidine cyclo-ligase
MVSSTDGVGTKLIVAQKAKRFDTVGQDLVNHCVNDIFVQGAVPQFFMDYIGLARMEPEVIKEIIAGMAKACIENEMCLIGGEMAEMPGIYHGEDFDLVGTIVGLVEKSNLVTGEAIEEGDVIIGFPSTGLHTNGYSLARKIVFDKLGLGVDSFVEEIGMTVGEALLAVHRSYYVTLKEYASKDMRLPRLVSEEQGKKDKSRNDKPIMHGMAHITGGGLSGNIKRILPADLCAEIDCNCWETPKLFKWLVEKGEVPLEDAYSAFNMGIGFVVITGEKQATEILKGTDGIKIGIITKRGNQKSVLLIFG